MLYLQSMAFDMHKLALVLLLILLSTFASISRAAPIVGYFDPFCRRGCLAHDPGLATASSIQSQDGTSKAGGSSSPGFDAVNGPTANLRGDVFGTGDYPLIDISTGISSTPPCPGPHCGGGANAFAADIALGAVGGSTTVSKLPEPSTCVLMLAALGAMGWATRRRKSALA